MQQILNRNQLWPYCYIESHNFCTLMYFSYYTIVLIARVHNIYKGSFIELLLIVI